MRSSCGLQRDDDANTKGEAQGIVCWKIDRLARNPVDGGQIQWLLQNSVITHIAYLRPKVIIPPTILLMMSVEFGMANQYIPAI